jgi:hypothetical protein
MSVPRLLTLQQQVDEIRKVDANTTITVKVLRRFLKKGLKHCHIGNTIFIRDGAYEEWVNEQETADYIAHPKGKAQKEGASCGK